MIRKPPAGFGRKSAGALRLEDLQTAARHGSALAQAGRYYLAGLVCWGFALLWGFAALAAGATGSGLPTFVGVGGMAAAMAWNGRRLFAKARAARCTAAPAAS
ncbi:hypothetical protein [Methylobacterium sp. Gmos1]